MGDVTEAVVDEADGAGDGAERIEFIGGGATGCGAANCVEDVGIDVGGAKEANGFD